MDASELTSANETEPVVLTYAQKRPIRKRGLALLIGGFIAFDLLVAGVAVVEYRSLRIPLPRRRSPNQTLEKAVIACQFNVGEYPVQLLDLFEPPEDPIARGKWVGPYLLDHEGLIDPWGTAYRYGRSAPGFDGPPFRLQSAGPDGQFNTSDDINNW